MTTTIMYFVAASYDPRRALEGIFYDTKDQAQVAADKANQWARDTLFQVREVQVYSVGPLPQEPVGPPQDPLRTPSGPPQDPGTDALESLLVDGIGTPPESPVSLDGGSLLEINRKLKDLSSHPAPPRVIPRKRPADPPPPPKAEETMPPGLPEPGDLAPSLERVYPQGRRPMRARVDRRGPRSPVGRATP